MIECRINVPAAHAQTLLSQKLQKMVGVRNDHVFKKKTGALNSNVTPDFLTGSSKYG